MSKFSSKNKKRGTEISTASLPDIIFMLLFFFMVATVMRETTLLVKVDLPKATETVRLEDRSLIDYIYIGEPDDDRLGTEPRIQLNDQFAEVEEVQGFIEIRRNNREVTGQGALIPLVTTVLKVDKGTRMGIIGDVKEELREVQALKINYSTLQRNTQ